MLYDVSKIFQSFLTYPFDSFYASNAFVIGEYKLYLFSSSNDSSDVQKKYTEKISAKLGDIYWVKITANFVRLKFS